jgi:hypothetical protein
MVLTIYALPLAISMDSYAASVADYSSRLYLFCDVVGGRTVITTTANGRMEARSDQEQLHRSE